MPSAGDHSGHISTVYYFGLLHYIACDVPLHVGKEHLVAGLEPSQLAEAVTVIVSRYHKIIRIGRTEVSADRFPEQVIIPGVIDRFLEIYRGYGKDPVNGCVFDILYLKSGSVILSILTVRKIRMF